MTFGPTDMDDFEDVNDTLEGNTAWTDPRSTHKPPTDPKYGEYKFTENGGKYRMDSPNEMEYGEFQDKTY